jgi:predicted negative regulator of RcsB-dependent stress response
MDVYQTESQQVEAIKSFFIRYARLFVFGFVLFIAVLGGSRYWQHHANVNETKASDVYQELLVAEMDQNSDVMQIKANDLIKQYSKTPYAQFAALMLARDAVSKQDFNLAEEHLRWIISQSSSKKATLHIATERLARILMQKGEYDAALKLLDAKAPDKSYISLYEQTKGDIYFAQGDVANAKIAYLKALQDLPEGAQNPVLQLKLVDLGVGVDNG